MQFFFFLAKCSISITPRLRENRSVDGDKSYTALKPDQFWFKSHPLFICFSIQNSYNHIHFKTL